MKKDWFFVGMTSLMELCWLFGFNVASSWWHWGIIITLIIFDFYFLSKACENLPTGTVYAVFAGVGTLGTACMDIFIFGEGFKMATLIFMIILLLGVIGLKIFDPQEEQVKEGNA